MLNIAGIHTELLSRIWQGAFLRSFACCEPLAFTKKKIYLGTQFGFCKGGMSGAGPVVPKPPNKYEIRFLDGRVRQLVRFDFSTEWNNTGNGSIGFGQGPFDLPGFVTVSNENYEPWGEIFDLDTNEKVSDYLGIIREKDEVILWCSRLVAGMDGCDWPLVEKFISDFECAQYGGAPKISEVPKGYRAGLLFRIDCDEAISSGEELFNLYAKYQVPMGLAIKTEQAISPQDRKFVKKALSQGGWICSHSHTHRPDWGGDPAYEIAESCAVLKDLGLDLSRPIDVVSPFHQNSMASRQGLIAVKVRGFVGGIACNDPEVLVYRSGVVIDGFASANLLTLSAQCMFHGDCYERQGEHIEIEKSAFDLAYRDGKIFGYLDHPFSNYHYGWKSEAERLSVHEEFLRFLKTYDRLWKPTLSEFFDFASAKSQIQLVKTGPCEFKIESSLGARELGMASSLAPKEQLSIVASMAGHQWDL